VFENAVVESNEDDLIQNPFAMLCVLMKLQEWYWEKCLYPAARKTSAGDEGHNYEELLQKAEFDVRRHIRVFLSFSRLFIRVE
jgi:hypothetical protein